MEENEFRSTYHSVNQQRCVFEKTIIARKASCRYMDRFCLAEREGVACREAQLQQRCNSLLANMRTKAIFALHLPRITEQLPHAKEVKVQTGGLIGLQNTLQNTVADDQVIQDIDALLQQAIEAYGSVEELPYDEIIRFIVKYEGRRRRAKSRR